MVRACRLLAMFTVFGAVASNSKGADRIDLPHWVSFVIIDRSTSDSRAAIRLGGIWNDSCVPDGIGTASVDNQVQLTVTHPGINVSCDDVETAWQLSHEIEFADPFNYSVFGSLFAIDPANPDQRRHVSGPDLLAERSPVNTRAVMQGLGWLPNLESSEANDVSSDGRTVVGTSRLAPGWAGFVASDGFVWTAADGMRGVGLLPPEPVGGSEAFGVSSDGRIAVGGSTADDFGKSFRWNAENQIQAIPALTEVSESRATATSSDGRFVVGVDQSFFPGPCCSDSRLAYRWSEGTDPISLGTLHERGGSAATDVSSDGQTVVGNAFQSQYDEEGNHRFVDFTEPFIWSEETGMKGIGHLTVVLDATLDYVYDTRANGVSADGTTVVGSSAIVPENFDLQGQRYERAFRYTADEGMVDIGAAPDAFLVRVEALDVSGDGSLIVGMQHYQLPPNVDAPDDWNPDRPFIWDKQHGVRLLSDVIDADLGLLDSGDLDYWHSLGHVTAISDDGRTIVGTGPRAEDQIWEAWRLVISHDYGAGDANLDGLFNSSDLVRVFQAGEYEDTIKQNSSWVTGDWNEDGEFTTSDLVKAFIESKYEGGELATQTVPEPASLVLVVIGLTVMCVRRHNESTGR